MNGAGVMICLEIFKAAEICRLSEIVYKGDGRGIYFAGR
jgi:hypothetical protein